MSRWSLPAAVERGEPVGELTRRRPSEASRRRPGRGPRRSRGDSQDDAPRTGRPSRPSLALAGSTGNMIGRRESGDLRGGQARPGRNRGSPGLATYSITMNHDEPSETSSCRATRFGWETSRSVRNSCLNRYSIAASTWFIIFTATSTPRRVSRAR